MAALVAPAALVVMIHRELSRRRSQRRRSKLCSGGSGGGGLLAVAAAPAPGLLGPSLLDLEALDSWSPHLFYLPGDAYSMEALADCFALVGGARLPLHCQVLAAQAAVLREMFVAQAEAGGAGASDKAAPAELSSAFAGCSPTEVAVFLRLLYSPDQATPGSLAAVHAHAAGLLAGVAGLAHRLDAAGLLVKIEGYLQAVAPAASVEELLDTVQLAEACHLAALGDACLTVLARRLAAAGPFWAEQLRRDRLAACSSESLATLACKLAATVHAGAFQPPEVHNVLPGHGGTAGGFTWCISRFSKQQGRVTSPWVEIGGLQWRLKVWPRGDDAGGGTHLSAYLESNYAQACTLGLLSIEAYYDFTFLDQTEDGLHHSVDCGKDVFTASTQNWGKTRMMPLEELARTDRAYLAGDRLAVRVSIRVLPSGAPASVAPPPAAVAPPVPPPAAPALAAALA